MTDHVTPALRSRVMSRIRSKGSKPEMVVRRLVHRMGFRYRLHRRDLPGSPDLVFARPKKVIFVHGCFWHQHDCARGTRPLSNTEFWNAKLDANVRRDQRNSNELNMRGWSVLTIWECETRDTEQLSKRIRLFLDG